MRLFHRVPAPPLDRFIDAIWVCESEPRPPALERILPTGSAQLIVNLKEDQTRGYDANGVVCEVRPGTVLTGLATRFQIIDTAEQEQVMGVCFRPGGTVPFFAFPVHEICNQGASLEVLWSPHRTSLLRDELLSTPTPLGKLDVMARALRAAWRGRALHPAVQFALCAFRTRPSMPTITAVTDAIALSPKRFIERFKADVGLTPKRYCRLLRFQRAVRHAHLATAVDWTHLALACGYFDQAHFNHDFRAFSGITPTAYQAARTPFHNHVNFLQSEAG